MLLNIKEIMKTDTLSHLECNELVNVINEHLVETKLELDFKGIVLMGPLFFPTFINLLDYSTLKKILVQNLDVNYILKFMKELNTRKQREESK